MQLPRSEQGLAAIGLPGIKMKLPAGDGHSNVQGKAVMVAHQQKNRI